MSSTHYTCTCGFSSELHADAMAHLKEHPGHPVRGPVKMQAVICRLRAPDRWPTLLAELIAIGCTLDKIRPMPAAVGGEDTGIDVAELFCPMDRVRHVNDLIRDYHRWSPNEVEMANVREYSGGYAVTIRPFGERWIVCAKNEGGYNNTTVDVGDLIAWLRANKPELLQ